MKQKITKKQKEAVFLLSIGTFLEYFDVFLYVHMSVVLNGIFFPTSDEVTSKAFTAFTFCSTYILRPIGGLVIGKLGDSIGRKSTIMITTFAMSMCCIVMAILPTYKEIGFTASIIMVICRMLQGFSSMGEGVGAQIYISEFLKSPNRNVAMGLVVVFQAVGGLFALSIASFVFSMSLNWRYVFGLGAFIAVIGFVARDRLRETDDFIEYQTNNQPDEKKNINKKTVMAYAFTEIHYPAPFYISYIYLGDFMKSRFGIKGEQIIYQNFKVAVFVVFTALFITFLVKKIHPIKIAIFVSTGFAVVMPFIPYFIDHAENLNQVFLIQCFLQLFLISGMGTLDSVQYKHFPIGSRFTVIATTFGVASTIAKVVVAFTLIPLTTVFGNYGILFLFAPSIISYFWALYYFKHLEIKNGEYYSYPNQKLSL